MTAIRDDDFGYSVLEYYDDRTDPTRLKSKRRKMTVQERHELDRQITAAYGNEGWKKDFSTLREVKDNICGERNRKL